MPGSVLVVGSINVDLVVSVARLPRPGQTVAGGSLARHGGGKGANQAVAAARAGARVRFVGAVGADDLGEQALAELAAEGIAVDDVVRVNDAPTGVAAIVVDSAGENQIAVASGANAMLDAAAVKAALEASAPPRDGVCLLNFEIGDAPLLAAARCARAGGTRALVVNPAPARPLPDALAALAPVLTPNAGEAAALSGEESPERAARVLADRTGAPVIVTLGAEGALLVQGQDGERFAPPEVEVVDATGAGDAFNGVLAAALAEGRGLAEAVPCAVAAASRSTRARGARGRSSLGGRHGRDPGPRSSGGGDPDRGGMST